MNVCAVGGMHPLRARLVACLVGGLKTGEWAAGHARRRTLVEREEARPPAEEPPDAAPPLEERACAWKGGQGV